ncbi:MAG TPA: hypothetical protein DEH22_05635 [Chloroflexi bacterium]|nr:hypothetical protein [Chloroflexota bacterium]
MLSYILLPFVVITFGILSFVLNGVFVWLAGQFINGFYVVDFATAAWTSVRLTVANLITSSLLTLDVSFWYRNLIRQRMKKREHYTGTDVPGVWFLEIDGLAKPLFEKAIAQGY